MILGYARVSSKDQNLDSQVKILNELGCEKLFLEKASGVNKDRIELNNLMDYARAGDTVIVSELTRISRSTKDLFYIVEKLEQKGANIKSIKESWLDTTTPQGKLMFTIFSGLAQFERDLISQRTKEGLAAAKARGRNGGRPNKRNEKAAVVEALYKQGMKISDIAKHTELSRSTVGRVIKGIK